MSILEDLPIEIIFRMMELSPETIPLLTATNRLAYNLIYNTKEYGEEYSKYFRLLIKNTTQHIKTDFEEGDLVLNGLKHGLWIFMGETGETIKTSFYKLNKLHGITRYIIPEYQPDPNRIVLQYIINYKEGVLDGVTSIKYEHTGGYITFNNGILDGKAKFYNRRGLYKGTFKNGEPSGRWNVPEIDEYIEERGYVYYYKNNLCKLASLYTIYKGIDVIYDKLLFPISDSFEDIFRYIQDNPLLVIPKVSKFTERDNGGTSTRYNIGEKIKYIAGENFVGLMFKNRSVVIESNSRSYDITYTVGNGIQNTIRYTFSKSSNRLIRITRFADLVGYSIDLSYDYKILYDEFDEKFVPQETETDTILTKIYKLSEQGDTMTFNINKYTGKIVSLTDSVLNVTNLIGLVHEGIIEQDGFSTKFHVKNKSIFLQCHDMTTKKQVFVINNSEYRSHHEINEDNYILIFNKTNNIEYISIEIGEQLYIYIYNADVMHKYIKYYKGTDMTEIEYIYDNIGNKKEERTYYERGEIYKIVTYKPDNFIETLTYYPNQVVKSEKITHNDIVTFLYKNYPEKNIERTWKFYENGNIESFYENGKKIKLNDEGLIYDETEESEEEIDEIESIGFEEFEEYF